ncbi:MAG: nitrogen fixation protein NifX [Symploca sp. SIO1C4]|uniref:Nitrogen fixation protein NifX n=1 Tax=Symploca sp. SIO1C4 TaxID=2607765 RepID=A0A6B3NEZ4_9CYAN|nr:nitrogen fixation protein NifX [Symploca sp. SIO1C4]NET05825.1 nitrogen fixation protein NifX [Symploca sp. SIO2B6]NET49971.1 nitrogen fixation protein NifX [Merismopedia sp. SIO2A8]
MKIAFATNDLLHVNGHFGSAKYMAVYEVNQESYQFVENLEFTGNLQQDGNENKVEPKIAALLDCTIVYVLAIGAGPAARLINKRVTPIKSKDEEEVITDLLNKLVETLNGNPPPWLRKALKPKERNFEEFEEELTV